MIETIFALVKKRGQPQLDDNVLWMQIPADADDMAEGEKHELDNHPEPGNWLWKNHRILTAHNPDTKSMRIAAAFYLLEDEIDLLADKLSELA